MFFFPFFFLEYESGSVLEHKPLYIDYIIEKLPHVEKRRSLRPAPGTGKTPNAETRCVANAFASERLFFPNAFSIYAHRKGGHEPCCSIDAGIDLPSSFHRQLFIYSIVARERLLVIIFTPIEYSN